MSAHVQKARHILADISPDYLELDSICLPPISFRDALDKARESTVTDLQRLSDESGKTTSAQALEVVRQNQRVTFSFLLMQLHARGNQEFWRDVDDTKLFCFLCYRCIDLYADVLTHLRTPTTPSGLDVTAALKDVSSPSAIDSLREECREIIHLIRIQRKNKLSDWQPNEIDCRAVMTAYADARVVAALKRMALHGGIIATIVGGITLYCLYRLRRS